MFLPPLKPSHTHTHTHTHTRTHTHTQTQTHTHTHANANTHTHTHLEPFELSHDHKGHNNDKGLMLIQEINQLPHILQQTGIAQHMNPVQLGV